MLRTMCIYVITNIGLTLVQETQKYTTKAGPHARELKDVETPRTSFIKAPEVVNGVMKELVIL